MGDCNRGGGDGYFASQQQLENTGQYLPQSASKHCAHKASKGRVPSETSSGKKYGGLQPKKKPLITKDHARAFFDSADWALYKQGAGLNQETMAVETLRPKLQRTPHQQLPPRRPTCTSGRDRLGE